ncbi:MAG: pyruvate dehydrogenase (acetyl-transferring), homodimeric type [Actinomycetota bacterium]|nr:pyruvate dehydrogenase (acetyl-transferring), homodimeric type [Actinomycetota bacterium]MDA3025628.1 pyruvate dehydrogenase (acetyl-transferring), homodimeric type [Actinomycetota bacterium]
MLFDGSVHQLPDTDPGETLEWLDSLDAVIDTHGKVRARYLLSRLLDRARESQVSFPATVSTHYVNTIPREMEPWFPGDEHIERRIRAYIRWNAAVMVVRANMAADGIGGHLSTFASSASLYEIGFNHFFRGKDDGTCGDHVYFQGHAAPGVYARAFLEGRLTEDDLDHFRREIGRDGRGLSSYPHPRLMPDFWEYPTVSMGLSPITAIYQARFNRYLMNRELDDTSQSRVWCYLGDGETDEPETLGALSLASREHLDNLVFVVNCNLQRLDGPVRGNGKIIQELEAVFRGAGWNVIKVIWGSKWDELLAQDKDGTLLNQMNTTVDGEFQRYSVEDGNYIRENFFGPDPRLRQMVAHLNDDELRNLPRGGHDYRKLYAAYRAATQNLGTGRPTAILCKTIKGWTLGPDIEGRNATHQIKKMTAAQLRTLRDRLHMNDEIPDAVLDAGEIPYFRPSEGSIEFQYLMERRRALGGSIPKRIVRARRPIELPTGDAFTEFDAGSGEQSVSTTMGFTRLLRNLARDPKLGPRVVPIIPDEARTFGMDSLFRELKIYAAHGQKYEPVDHDLLLSYAESSNGQILEEGITEAGAMSSFIAAGTSYANRGVPMVPFYTFYSMFGFQRVGDLIWQAADIRARGFLMAATAGRTTLLGEGLQHQDGHSLVLASTVPACQAYDPAFAYEVSAIIKHGLQRMYGGGAGPNGDTDPDVFYYLTLYNENYVMPARPSHVTDLDIVQGLYKWADAPQGTSKRVTLLFSGSAQGAARAAAAELAEHWDVGAELWSATSYKTLREDALAAERWNRLNPPQVARTPLVTELMADTPGPIVAVSDFMKIVPEQIARFVPGRTFVPLGTDGMGRSDTREALRSFFETDMPNIVLAVIASLVKDGKMPSSAIGEVITKYGLDPLRVDPYQV